VSGGGEAACLIDEPLITSRLSPVEISFNMNFLQFPNEETGRTGGIFYGAPSAESTRTNRPTIAWTDRKVEQGYSVYNNVDKNKAYGLSPGPNPNRHWKIVIAVDGKASFTAGPQTWFEDFTPQISGEYIGFWVASGNVMKITDFKVVALPLPGTDGHEDKPKTNKFYSGIQLSVDSTEPYGSGVGRFFYSESGGKGLEAKSLYLEGPSDFRTREGSIAAAADLYAAHALIVKDFAVDDLHGARLFFVQNGHDRFENNAFYLQDGDFRTEATSILTDQSVRAQEMQIGGKEFASMWYSQAGNRKDVRAQAPADDAVLLKHGDFAIAGSVTGKNVRASEYIRIKASPGFGKGAAQFWYSEIGQNQVLSKTLYLQNCDFRTAEGSIFASRDLGGASIQINALESYGHGRATLVYTKAGNAYYQPNSLHAHRVGFSTQHGSINAGKNVHVGRLLNVHASVSGSAGGGDQGTLWYSQSAGRGTQYRSGTLYLKSGDLRTEDGSFCSAQDVFANRYLQIGKGLVNSDSAKLWYSATATSTHKGKSVYLQSGDLRTEAGDIHSTTFVAGRYLAVGSETQAKLYFSATSVHGKEARSVYLQDGDFRIESGSVISQQIAAHQFVKISACSGFGTGMANLYYVDTPIGKHGGHVHTLYNAQGDFRTEKGSIASSHNIGAPSVKLAAYNGHGNGEVELWFGRRGETLGALKNGPTNHLYLREGHFETQAGNIISSVDLVVKTGSVVISAREGYGKTQTRRSDKAELWYSSVGRDTIHAATLHLKKGSFKIQSGSLHSKKDVVTAKSLMSSKIQVDEASCEDCNFNKIYLKTSRHVKRHALEDALVLLQEGDDESHLDVGVALAKLQERHITVLEEHMSLKDAINAAHAKLSRLEVS